MARAEVAKPGLAVLPEALLSVGGVQFLIGLRSALNWLQANQEIVNDLNVFPVPDGDTGSNMYLTLRSAVEEAQRAADPASVASVLGAVAHGSLMGARGNSGVILSQIFRGFAAGVAGHSEIDAEALAGGLVEAAAMAYRAVMKPTEGTVLTVIREAADAARAAATETDDVRIVLERATSRAHAAVERTIDQLAVLREAGVVDAGGFGLAVILEGFTRAFGDGSQRELVDSPDTTRVEPRLRSPEDAEAEQRSDSASSMPLRRGAAAVAEKESGWGYCTEFLIHGPGLDPAALRETLGAMGDSALVVGDGDLVRVHIHTDDPSTLIMTASQRGRLSKLKVEDMTAQHHDVLERADAAAAGGSGHAAPATEAKSPRVALAVVAVAPGAGFRDIFAGLGSAVVVEGGQTMNPSTEDLLNAVRAANADAVLLLPNNGNVILTAQQVNALAPDVEVVVVPTRNLVQGVSALLALDPSAAATPNGQRMATASGAVTCVEITRAVRNTRVNGLRIKNGDVIALVDDQITEVGADPTAVITAVLAKRDSALELVTIYRGVDPPEAEAEALVSALRAEFPAVEFELHVGGQEHYFYILSLE